jgi:hypothetical protein
MCLFGSLFVSKMLGQQLLVLKTDYCAAQWASPFAGKKPQFCRFGANHSTALAKNYSYTISPTVVMVENCGYLYLYSRISATVIEINLKANRFLNMDH